MLRATASCILITLLVSGAIPAPAAEPTVAEQVAKLKVGRKIKVELNGGETLKGRMGSATADQFALEPRNTAQGTARVVRFNEAQTKGDVPVGDLGSGSDYTAFLQHSGVPSSDVSSSGSDGVFNSGFLQFFLVV